MLDLQFRKIVRKLQQAGHLDVTALSDQAIEDRIIRLVLGIPDDVAGPAEVAELFGDDYFPGTFRIGELKTARGFFPAEASIGYENWIRTELHKDLLGIHDALGRQGQTLDLNGLGGVMEAIEEDIVTLLDHPVGGRGRICDLIALQEYTDIFRRLILLLLFGNPELEIDTYAALNSQGREVALAILAECDNWSLHKLLKISLASGLVGLNLKTSASATSRIYQHNIIPIQLNMSLGSQVEYVRQRLEEKARERMAISFWPEYQSEVLRTDQASSLAFFTDDFIETVFDLKLVERQLQANPNLTVYLIPRCLRYGNDASYADVMDLLTHPVLEGLESLHAKGRLQVCSRGPMAGTVNGLKISAEIASILKRCDCVVVKGARAYEMLQGIRKVTYFGFAVCREISESVTGIDAEKGRAVFIRHGPGERSFEGFRDRDRRCRISGTGRRYYLAQVTASDFRGQTREAAKLKRG